MSIAELGVKVTGSGVLLTTKQLEQLAVASRKAETKSDTLTKAVRRQGAAFGFMRGQMRSALVAYAGFAAARAAIGTLVDFEMGMSRVGAVTRATSGELAAMRDIAKELGSTTEFTAGQAANGLSFLGMAGFSAAESIAAIPDVLNLATAGAMDLGVAADIASNIMSGFSIEAENAGDVADVLAAASTRANTNVHQLGDEMKFVAPVANALGMSINDTAAAIGVLSDAGLQGSMAGTGLRRVLSSLVNPTSEAADVIKALGVSLSDVNPETESLVDIVDTLAASGLDAADALTIFGDRGGPAILALTSQVDSLRDLTGELQNVGGEAERMAEIMRDNLGGDITELKSALAGLIIALGEAGLTAALRGLVQAFVGVTRVFSAAVDFVDELGVALLLLAVVRLPSLLAPTFRAIGAMTALQIRMAATAVTSSLMAKSLLSLRWAVGFLGGPLGVAIVAVGTAIYSGMNRSSISANGLTANMDALEVAIVDYTDAAMNATKASEDMAFGFTNVSGAMQKTLNILADQGYARIVSEMDDVVAGLVGIAKVGDTLNPNALARFFDLNGLFGWAGLARESKDEMSELLGLFKDFESANGFQAQADAGAELLVRFNELAMASGDINAEESLFIGALGQAVLKMNELAASSEKVADDLGDFGQDSDKIAGGFRAVLAYVVDFNDVRAESLTIANDVLKGLQQEVALQSMIAQFGADSEAVRLLMLQQEREALMLKINELDVAQSIKDEVLATWNAAERLKNTNMSAGIEVAASAAEALADRLNVSLATAQAIVDMGSTGGGGRGSINPTRVDAILAGMGGVYVEYADALDVVATSGAGAAAALTETETAAEALAKRLDDRVMSAIDDLGGAFKDFAMRGFRDFQSFASSVFNTFKKMLLDMIMMADKNKVMIGIEAGGGGLKGIMSLFKGGGKGGGGLLAGAFGSFGTAAAGGATGLLGGLGSTLGVGAAAGASTGLFGIGAGAAAAGGGIMATLGAALPLLGIGLALFAAFKPKINKKDFAAIQNGLDLTGMALFEAGRKGKNMAADLLKSFGSIDEYNKATTDYYNNFFTEEEKRQRAIDDMAKAFGDIGMAVPESTEAFRAMVEAQDLTTKSGRKAYAEMLKVSGAFADVYGGVKSVNSAFALMNRRSGIFATLQDEIFATAYKKPTTGSVSVAKQGGGTEGSEANSWLKKISEDILHGNLSIAKNTGDTAAWLERETLRPTT